jgi:hypothetical protein
MERGAECAADYISLVGPANHALDPTAHLNPSHISPNPSQARQDSLLHYNGPSFDVINSRNNTFKKPLQYAESMRSTRLYAKMAQVRLAEYCCLHNQAVGHVDDQRLPAPQRPLPISQYEVLQRSTRVDHV